jgi:hypothetical protein
VVAQLKCSLAPCMKRMNCDGVTLRETRAEGKLPHIFDKTHPVTCPFSPPIITLRPLLQMYATPAYGSPDHFDGLCLITAHAETIRRSGPTLDQNSTRRSRSRANLGRRTVAGLLASVRGVEFMWI